MRRILGFAIAALLVSGQLLALREPGPPAILQHLSPGLMEIKGEQRAALIVDGEVDDYGLMKAQADLEEKGIACGPVLMVRTGKDAEFPHVVPLKDALMNVLSPKIKIYYDYELWKAAVKEYFTDSKVVTIMVSAPTDLLVSLHQEVLSWGQWLDVLAYTGNFNIRGLHSQLAVLSKDADVRIADISAFHLFPKGWDETVKNMATLGEDFQARLQVSNPKLYEVMAPLQIEMNQTLLLPPARAFEEKKVTPEVLAHANRLLKINFSSYLGYLRQLVDKEEVAMIRGIKISTIKKIEIDAPLRDLLLAWLPTLKADEVKVIQGNWVYDEATKVSHVEPSEGGNTFSYILTQKESVSKFQQMIERTYLTSM